MRVDVMFVICDTPRQFIVFVVYFSAMSTMVHFHTPRRIFSRTPVCWSRNQFPPIFSILSTFRSNNFFQRYDISIQMAIDVV